MDDRVEIIPLASLHEPAILLRPVVKDSIEYLERRDSIERDGFLQSLLVRESPSQPGKYEIIDGMWRYTAGQETSKTKAPCIIKTGLTDDEVLSMQLKANALRTETTKIEYARQLRRLIERRPGMTFVELARLAGKHPTWIKDTLNLLSLDQETQTLVDRGMMPIKSAYMLAKLPSKLRGSYVEAACLLPEKQFVPLAAGLMKQYKEAVHQGKLDHRYLSEFTPNPYLRGIKEIKAELESTAVGGSLIAAENCKSLTDVWRLCLRWALNIDRQSILMRKLNAEQKTRKAIKREVSNEALDEDVP